MYIEHYEFSTYNLDGGENGKDIMYYQYYVVIFITVYVLIFKSNWLLYTALFQVLL